MCSVALRLWTLESEIPPLDRMTSRTKTLFLLVAIVALGAAGVLWWRAHHSQVATTPKPENAPSAIVAAPATAPTTPSVPVSSPPNSTPVAALPSAASATTAIATPQSQAPETPSTADLATAHARPKATTPDDATPTKPTATSQATATAIGNLPPRIDEVVGTERMIAAHAELRKPEVANPDSAGNRRVLDIMLRKALLRAETAPATHVPSQP